MIENKVNGRIWKYYQRIEDTSNYKKECFGRLPLFCVLKKWIHSRIGQCVRPSLCLHDNSSQLHSIELKFFAQSSRINISVEWRRWEGFVKKRLSYRKNCHYWPQTFPGWRYRDFFLKQIFFSVSSTTNTSRRSF